MDAHLKFSLRYEESTQISLSQMDKKKSSKDDFDNAIKGNENLKNMTYHTMNFDELEQSLETRINNSK
jgi:hypothetical protein